MTCSERFTRVLTLLCGIACAATGCVSGGTTTASEETPGTIQVAVWNNYPPAEFVDNGELTGWMIDMLEPLERESGLRFEIRQINQFSTLIPGLQSGRFDAAAANLTVSAERMQVIDMVTVGSVGTGFSTPVGGGVAIRSALDVCGKEVSALSGSVFEPQLKTINTECATAGKPAARANLYPDTSAAVLAAANGRVQVFMGSYAEVVYSADESNQLTVQPYQFAKLPEAIGFPKGSPYMRRVLDAMNRLIDSGEYQAVLDKWGAKDIAITKSQLNPTVD
jgi:polar amino acid transport system substrate-binding protein